jgi:hypothetical protein
MNVRACPAATTSQPANTGTGRRSISTLRLTKAKRVWCACSLIVALLPAVSPRLHAAGDSRDKIDGPADTFSILLQGIYGPVTHGPNLGLLDVNLNDGSYSTTKIYPVSGLPQRDSRGNGSGDHDGGVRGAIGNFYVQFAGNLAVYDLPGGALTMAFTGSDVKNVADGEGGTYIVGTFDLDIQEGTGVFRSFTGGHNRMVDVLHQLPDGRFEERCICIISRA